jgi:hypothetical protein
MIHRVDWSKRNYNQLASSPILLTLCGKNLAWKSLEDSCRINEGCPDCYQVWKETKIYPIKFLRPKDDENAS